MAIVSPQKLHVAEDWVRSKRSCPNCGRKRTVEIGVYKDGSKNLECSGCNWVIFEIQPDPSVHRRGAGKTACKYCGEKNCDYSCDESQAGGFNKPEVR